MIDFTDIRKKLFTAEFLTGLFCIGALIILFYFTAVIRGKDMFSNAKKHPLVIEFPYAGSLSVNDKVKVIGVEMGSVASIELASGNTTVIVKTLMNREILLYSDYSVTLQNSSIFGGAYININPGKKTTEVLPRGTIFKGLPPIDIIQEASGLIAALKEDEKYFRESVIQGGVFDKIKDALGNLEANSKDFRDICADIKAGKGTIGKFFTDPSFYNEATGSFTEISKTTGKVNDIINDLQSGKGTLGKLITKDDAYNSMMDSVENIKNVTKKMAEGENSFGKMLKDDGKLYSDLSETMKNAREISDMLREGKGTIGLLLKDEALYRETKDTVRQIRAAVEDLREMAPVATFGSIALGAL